MSAPESPLEARCPSALGAEASGGWRGSDRISLVVQQGVCAVLITIAGDGVAAFASEAVERLGAPLPPARYASFGGAVAVVAAGRNTFLAVKQGDAACAFSSRLAGELAGPATAVDQSDQLVFFALEGASSARALSALCSVDFDPRAFAEGTAIVTRLQDVRAYVWREPGPSRYLIGVQRSLASHVWTALLEACRTHSPAP